MADGVQVGVDLGGTTMTIAAVDAAGRMGHIEKRETRAQDGADRLIDRICESVLRVARQASDQGGVVHGVGMGIPGLIDREEGVTRYAPNLQWRDVPVAARVEDAVGLPVTIENDVRCAALGERAFGAGQTARTLVLITLGTGIGSGLILDGALYRGPGGFAGEIGHQTIDPAGPDCGCGNRGCVEAFAAAPGIVRRARSVYAAKRPSRWQARLMGDPDRVTPLLLHELALEGDAAAIELWAETGRYVGIAMANCVNVLNPERILVGGGVAGAGEFLLGPMRREIERRALPPAAGMVEVVPAALGTDAGVIGAATLVRAAHERGAPNRSSA